MKRWIVIAVTALLLSAASFAGPAWKGVLTLRQPDGTSLQATLSGDEFAHIMKDLDGNALVQNEDGFWCYAIYSPDGTVHSSGMIAGKDRRPAGASYIPYDAINAAASARRRAFGALARVRSLDESGPKKRHCIILLADFQDVKMTHPREMFVDLITGKANSARKYFEDQFLGQCEFDFEVGPLVTLSHSQKYYGKNLNGSDSKASEAIVEACTLSHEAGVDFSKFDDTGDGSVDNVFLYVAGKDEADGGGDDCIWSHAWKLSSSGIDLVLDGKRIDGYAISTELSRRQNGKYAFRTIGSFCHEYGHVLGLKDLYGNDLAGSGGTSEGLWQTTAIMDHGNYNNEGRTPPYFNAIDRDCLGIGSPESLSLGDYVLEPINEKGRYLKFETSVPGEYYLIECRANNGWDLYCGGRGLAIYHIDKSGNSSGYSPVYERDATAVERWLSNEVNCRPQHQCADMVEANPKAENVRQVFWPFGKNNYFSPHSSPAFLLWDGSSPEFALTDIRIAGDKVCFSVVKSGDANPSRVISSEKDVFQDVAIISWISDNADSGAPATVEWGIAGGTMKAEEVTPYSPGHYAIRLEGLKQGASYSMKIYYRAGDVKGKEYPVTFTTKSAYALGYPFIYLKGAVRNEDGTFVAGARIPLVVFNLVNAKSVEWFMDGRSIVAGADGYFALTRSCVIRALVTYVDGAVDIIEKKVTIR